MASSTGDVRRALELLKRSLDMAEAEMRKAGKPLITPAACKGAVTVGARGQIETGACAVSGRPPADARVLLARAQSWWVGCEGTEVWAQCLCVRMLNGCLLQGRSHGGFMGTEARACAGSMHAAVGGHCRGGRLKHALTT